MTTNEELEKARERIIEAIAGGTITVPGGYGNLERDDAENIADAAIDAIGLADRLAALTTPQAVCTCPSGDGSLRWPCPAHPPAPQEGDARSPEFEVLEQELFKHQPVLSMEDGSIRGCQCLDRVFHRGTEDWGTHLAEVFENLSRTTSPDAATELERAHNLVNLREFEIDNLDELITELKAERDAAVAAVERVQDTLSLHNPNGRLVKEVLAALDGAPAETEWEWGYRGETLRDVHARKTRESAEGAAKDLTEYWALHGKKFEVVRRRKAGPWEPVGGETDE